LYACWDGLTSALKTGTPVNYDEHSARERFSALYADPVRLLQFLKGMTGGSLPVAQDIARKFPWERYATFADVGTAEGCLPVQVALSHSAIRGIGFDLPPVRPAFERYVEAHALEDRLEFQSGNFLEDPLPSVEVLIMGRVLHNWDLATKKQLLANAFSALPPGGALIVYDRLIDDARRENVAGLLASLNMLVMTPGGFDYTAADCQEWMHEIGFRECRTEGLAISHGMIVGTK
jgi:hypothetical protein